MDIEQGKINQRLDCLTQFKAKKPYQRQKSCLQSQLESFLWSLPERKTIAAASPRDVVSFLVWRDKFGKTAVHSDNCLATRNSGNCSCRRGLAAGTVDNNIGKLRTIFRECGRGTTWNCELNKGNPAAHSSVAEYHALVLEEQTIARAFPVQAVPLFTDKLEKLCNHLRSLMLEPSLKPVSLYILARDLAFFTIDFFSGDRASDLGRVKSTDVVRLEDDNCFIFKQVYGKCLRGNRAHVFSIQRIPQSSVCPVRNFLSYLELSQKMGIDLSTGFLFRATDGHTKVKAEPFVGSTVANRLQRHLNDLSINQGETMHSFRSGCSITLAMLGVSDKKIADHVGWRSVEMARYYCQYDKVSGAGCPSKILSQNAATQPSTVATSKYLLEQEFRDMNSLKNAKPLFD